MDKINFQFRHINRIKFPIKHILICEDDIEMQYEIFKHFKNIFESQGDVIISCVAGSIEAFALIQTKCFDLIILDHDMPYGNGSDFLLALKQINFNIPIFTFSGCLANNNHMIKLGATYKFLKQDIIDGKADNLIKSILFEKQKN